MNSDSADGERTAALRQMVETQLSARGIRDRRVLDAMAAVPRERFVPPEYAALAYTDQALPIEESQTISQPYIVALMTEALALLPQHRVLEIGTGSGYQAAVLAELVGELHTVERLASLSDRATRRLAELGVTNVRFHVGDGSLGWPSHAPYDRIIVTAGAPAVPETLIDQLAGGGRLILPVGNAGEQRLTVLRKLPGRIVERPLIGCRFVKLVGSAGWA